MHPKTRRCLVLLATLMHATLVWSQAAGCTLQQFKQSSEYDGNFDLTGMDETYPDKKSVRVGCRVGYSGFFKITCSGNNWTYRGRKCEPRACGHPGDAQFADFRLAKGEDFVFGSQVEYTCHKGFIMASRRNNRRCMAEGWDGAVPVCEPLHCPAIYPDSSVLVQGDTENANYRNSVRFSCRSNRHILSGPQEISCNEHGEWSGPVPICIEIKCERPNIPNGFVSGPVIEYWENDFLHYGCNPKYQPAAAMLPKCTNLGLRADWSPAPKCDAVKCRLDVTAADREHTFNPPQKNLFFPDETLFIQCGQRYWIGSKHNTQLTTTCQENGKWSADPTCMEVVCSNVKPFTVNQWGVDSRQRVLLGNSTWYECRSRYQSTDPSSRAECTRDGWSPNPLCREKTCRPVQMNNTKLVNENKEYRLDEKISYVCIKGYHGKPERTCTENGWSGESQCTDARCRHRQISDAHPEQPVKDFYNHGDKIQYTCNNNNKFNVTCKMGEWDGIQECSGCRDVQLENGFVVKRNANTIHFRCNEGYKLSTHIDWGVATCQDGNWTGFSGQCIVNTACGTLPVILHGKLEGDQHANEEGSSVAVICEEGFVPQVQNFVCKSAKWNSSGKLFSDVCTPNPKYCRTPPEIENTVVMSSATLFPPNSEVTYQCRPNFSQVGNTKSVCNNGQWGTVNLVCTPPKCHLQVRAANPETTYNPEKEVFLPSESLSIQCGETYWVGSKHNTSAVTMCQYDGTWSVDPTCSEVVCTSEQPRSVSRWNIQPGKVTLGQTAQYWCGPDSESKTAECTRDGWSPRLLCGVQCERQVVAGDQETTYDPPHKYVFSPGESLSIQCGERYWVGSKHNTSAVITCQYDGTWSVDPRCREDFCTSEKPPLVSSWRVMSGQEVRLREKTRYNCISGNTGPSGPRRAECTRDGWKPNPLCQAVDPNN